jgi:DNA-binding NtrC family response regulator
MQTFNRDIRPGLPVILCSGYGENFSPADVRKKGLYLFLQKPVSLEALAGIIRKCLDDPEPLL